jgi:hypothetical protein
MKVGFTGHQSRPGIDWVWVERTLRTQLTGIGEVECAFSSLAVGSDQVFAKVALGLRIPVIAVVPIDDYEDQFEEGALGEYRKLLAQCTRLDLHLEGDTEQAFFKAGQFIATACDLMLAVWDGEPAAGVGGTGDVVRYARRLGRPTVHINPLEKTVQRV